MTSEDLGRLSVLFRQNAATNPAAWFYGQPITLEDHQKSRWIVPPHLKLLDCCQESDGGVAIIVTRRDRARDLKQIPARLLGAEYAFLFNHEIISDFYEGDLAELANSVRVKERLTAAAGVAPHETNVAMIYDNFTPQVLRQLEAFGYCPPGEGKNYIADGHMNLDGKISAQPQWRPDRRGLYSRHEQYHRRRAPVARHGGEPGEKCRDGVHVLGRRGRDHRAVMRLGVTVGTAFAGDVAYDVLAPDTLTAGSRLLFCIPGGGVNRGYFAMPGFDFAGAMVAAGHVVVLVDPPGVGEFDPPG